MVTINDYANFHFLFQGYGLSDQDTKSTDADVIYYGYVNARGEWYIMEEDQSVGGDADLKSWRYIKGASDYSTTWAARESQSYDTFETTFK